LHFSVATESRPFGLLLRYILMTRTIIRTIARTLSCSDKYVQYKVYYNIGTTRISMIKGCTQVSILMTGIGIGDTIIEPK